MASALKVLKFLHHNRFLTVVLNAQQFPSLFTTAVQNTNPAHTALYRQTHTEYWLLNCTVYSLHIQYIPYMYCIFLTCNVHSLHVVYIRFFTCTQILYILYMWCVVVKCTDILYFVSHYKNCFRTHILHSIHFNSTENQSAHTVPIPFDKQSSDSVHSVPAFYMMCLMSETSYLLNFLLFGQGTI